MPQGLWQIISSMKNRMGLLAELEVFIGKQVQIKTEVYYNQEQFDVVVM